jgi:serine/threonine protein kinase
MVETARDADRNLLFGVLALQVDAISRSQFIEACSAWATHKDTPLAQLLVDRGWMSAADRQDVERLVQRKLEKHQGNVQSSLADLAGEHLRQTLAGLPDANLHFSVGRTPPTEAARRLPTVTTDAEARSRYHLSRLHAVGGIGKVWVARDGSLDREVALKELRPESMENPVYLARFLEEARITGQLEHPGIVPVYELSQDANGHPFYIMRLIRGRTLSAAVRLYHIKLKHGDAGPLDLRELLNAFAAVCNTIAYAHSRGVIHRDLKGSNIVLGDFGEVIVLDWGLAKALSKPAGSTEVTPVPEVQTVRVDRKPSVQPASLAPSQELTVQGQILGTPAYMAPEQAEGRVEAIDARTDVYGLGAILYEILAGQAPFPVEEAPDMLRRVINEPPLPPRYHVPSTPPALEAICLMALAKRQDQRYPSAASLAHEIQRYLADEPVKAYPERWPARLGRWGRRHRVLVASAAVLLVTAVAALGTGMVLLSQANARTEAQRDVATANLTEAEKQKAEAERQRHNAETNLVKARKAEGEAKTAANKAKAINDFLVDDLLSEANPERNPVAAKITVEEVVKRAAAKVGTAFPDHPETEAGVRYTLGDVFYRLGLYGASSEQLQQSLNIYTRTLGPENQETLSVMTLLAELLWAEGKDEEAVQYGRKVLDMTRRVLGPDHKRTMTAENNLGLALQRRNRLAEAEVLYQDTLRRRRELFGPYHPYTVNQINNLARLYFEEGRSTEAVKLQEQALADALKIPNLDSMLRTALTVNRAAFYGDVGRLRESESELRKALEDSYRNLGPDHQYSLITVNNLNRVLVIEERYGEAEPASRRNLDACRRVLGKNHPKTLIASDVLAETLVGLGKAKEAEPIVRETLAIRRKVFAPGHMDLGTSLYLLGLVLTDKPAEAEPALREALQIRRTVLAPGYWQTAQVESLLGKVWTALKRHDEAEQSLLSAYRALEASVGAPEPLRRHTAERLVRLYTAWGKPDQAKEWRDKASASPKPNEPPQG